jgi:hypothetical protein
MSSLRSDCARLFLDIYAPVFTRPAALLIDFDADDAIFPTHVRRLDLRTERRGRLPEMGEAGVELALADGCGRAASLAGEVVRVLKPGGVLFLVTGPEEPPAVPELAVLESFRLHDGPGLSAAVLVKHLAHVRHHPRRMLHRLPEATGRARPADALGELGPARWIEEARRTLGLLRRAG